MPRVWSQWQDQVILDGAARGDSASEIAIQLGSEFTRNMVIGRHKRIRGIVSPCEKRAKAARADANKKIAAEQKAFRASIVAEANRRRHNGEDRDYLISALRQRPGVTLNILSEAFGVTKERIRQICESQHA